MGTIIKPLKLNEIQEKRDELLKAAAQIYGRPVLIEVMDDHPRRNQGHRYKLYGGEYSNPSDTTRVAFFSTVEAFPFHIAPVFLTEIGKTLESGEKCWYLPEKDSEYYEKFLDQSVRNLFFYEIKNIWSPDVVIEESPELNQTKEILEDPRMFNSLNELKELVVQKNLDHIISDLFMEHPENGKGCIMAVLSNTPKERIFAKYTLCDKK